MAEPDPFIGRAKEISLLRDTINSSRASIALVYGRRRIGKTSLITKALEHRSFLTFEGLENRSTKQQIEAFLFQLHHGQHPSEELKKAKSWREALMHLYQAVKSEPCHMVFDELQWMANYRKDMISDLKMMWDQYFSKLPGLTLIVCGSNASFMVKKVLNSSALYGRVDLQIELHPFTLGETAQILPEKGFAEQLDAHLYTGGVPKYLELLQGSNSNTIAMNQEAFTPSGYLVSEFDRIFLSHFGGNSNFKVLISTLAAHPYGLLRSDLIRLAGFKKGGLHTNHLDDLESAGFIRYSVPFDKAENSKLKKYFLTDAYLRFYFSFVEPARQQIKGGFADNLFMQISQSAAYYNWRGRAFEYLCLQHADVVARILGFPGINYRCGPYFRGHRDGKAGMQADLIFDRADNVLTLCEMKYSAATIGVNIIDEVEPKCNILRQLYPKKTIQKVLITVSKPSKDLQNHSYFYRIIMAEELL